MDLTAVRVALTAAVQRLSTPARPLTALGYVPSRLTPPTIYVQPTGVSFDQAMVRGMDYFDFSVVLVVGNQDDQSAQDLLDTYLAGSGPGSVKAAVEAARGGPGQPALGGAADDLILTSVDAYRWIQFGSTTYLGAEFKVRVLGSG